MTQRRTVLIVEDDDGIRSLLVAVVERDGFHSQAARDGGAALKALDDGADPDVILLDLVMPNVDGFTVLGHLERNAPHLVPRVIVLTAASESHYRKRAELNRVWCVRRKPLEIDDLRAQLLLCAEAARSVDA